LLAAGSPVRPQLGYQAQVRPDTNPICAHRLAGADNLAP